ncbi:glycoside hydrolase family 28 protein [Paraglaciecola hydrolytica]|uniref:Glycoside hydrolase n=1 Tax=Paraglaciecola hydrolytica TaxID=1799789 RepID=A0A148KKE9_9ALTE|nr:glycoside hydrolase family 28 protein [Paraglaciecola hydrolytica]KXI26767.1 hypothetical protein AX660_03065 [Paraglaciecola hydrolytica]
MIKVTIKQQSAAIAQGLLLVFLLLNRPLSAQELTLDDLYQDVPFVMPKVVLPSIPVRQVSLLQFGGVADGVSDNTQAFADAIQALVKQGGGRVIVPRGIWLTGPIQLQSNIDLHVEHGALIKFSVDRNLYPMVHTNFEGRASWRPMSPIYAKNTQNIAITGKGIIDGSGDSWRLVKKSKLTEDQWRELVASGGVVSEDNKTWYPSLEFKEGTRQSRVYDTFKYNQQQATKIKDFLRPVMVSLVDSDKILLDGPTFQNSPAWNIHILTSQNVVVRNTQVRNPWYGQNGDGIDLDSVKNALIYNNSFDVGDDAICIKSGKDEEGRLRAMPTENIIIKNNVVYHGHGGFVVGSEMSGGVKNILFSKATFIGTDIGIRFKTTRGRGGIVENIWVSDVDMVGIKGAAVSFNMYYAFNTTVTKKDRNSNKSAEPVDETTPQLKDIAISNIRAIDVGTAALFQGLPEMKLSNVTMENAYFASQKGISIVDVQDISLSNIEVHSVHDEALEIVNVKHANLTNLQLKPKAFVVVKGQESDKVSFVNNQAGLTEFPVKNSPEVKPNAVSVKFTDF